MYLLFMIKARIRWCTCRVENILTLGKLVSLWFVSSSILFVFDISNLLSYIQISSYELARPIMGTIFLVYGPWFTIVIYCTRCGATGSHNFFNGLCRVAPLEYFREPVSEY